MKVASVVLVLGCLLRAEDSYPALLDQARAEPVEIFADIAFRVLDKLPAKEKIAVLEEIFLRAGQAREAVPLRDAFARPGARAEVYKLRLDALSLRCRAVREMSKLSAQRARELFEVIPPREAPYQDCRREFVPDTGIYVETAALLGGANRLLDAERTLRGAANSFELAAGARTLMAFARTEKEAAILNSALISALALKDSDHSFDTAGVSDEVLALQPATAVLSALRGYLVRHLTGVRCTGGNATQSERFNRAVAGVPAVLPITNEETVPARWEGRVDVTAPAAPEVLNEVRALGRVRKGESLWQVRLTADWTARARQALTRAERWKGAEGQDAADILRLRSQLFSAIADAAPAGEIQDAAIDGWIAVLEDVEALRQTPAVWRVELGRLLLHQESMPAEAIRAMRQTLGETREGLSFAPLSGPRFLQRLAASPLNALSLYGRAFLLSKE